MSAADLCVIYNPTAGRGRAARRLESLRQALGPRAEFRPTTAVGHAEELALDAAKAGFPLVAAAGGDGTIHEVANGLLRSGRPDAALAVYPIGSANDYAHSLGLTEGWWARPHPVALRSVDVGLARGPDGRERYFVNALGLGLNGAVNFESCRVAWLRGLPRYGVALVRALWSRYKHLPLTVTLDGQARSAPTLALSVAIGKREGNFCLAPRAEIGDGLFDYLHAGPIPRWELLWHVPGMITGNLPAEHPRLWTGRCREVRVAAEGPLIVHVDGEFFCLPEENVRELEVRILPGKLRVLSTQS